MLNGVRHHGNLIRDSSGTHQASASSREPAPGQSPPLTSRRQPLFPASSNNVASATAHRPSSPVTIGSLFPRAASMNDRSSASSGSTFVTRSLGHVALLDPGGRAPSHPTGSAQSDSHRRTDPGRYSLSTNMPRSHRSRATHAPSRGSSQSTSSTPSTPLSKRSIAESKSSCVACTLRSTSADTRRHRAADEPAHDVQFVRRQVEHHPDVVDVGGKGRQSPPVHWKLPDPSVPPASRGWKLDDRGVEPLDVPHGRETRPADLWRVEFRPSA